MNRYKGAKRFLYITPYLNEVDRICEQCDFDQSDSDYMSKSAELKTHIRHGKNVAATHSLFYLMDEEALELVRANHYSLIIDESIQVIERLNVTDKDSRLSSASLLMWVRMALSAGKTKSTMVGSVTTRNWPMPVPCA